MSAPAPPAALHVRGLRKTYKDVVAVDGVDLEVSPGECFGLLGPNGAGKTTTIEICEGLTAADCGGGRGAGTHLADTTAGLRERLGIQLQETQLSDKLTVLETVTLFRSFFRRGPAPAEAMARVRTRPRSSTRAWGRCRAARNNGSRSPARWSANPNCCSSTNRPPASTRRRAGRCGTWCVSSSATAAPSLLTTHYMDEAEQLCERVAIMDHGKVIARGTPRELIASIGVEHVVECSAMACSISTRRRRSPGVRDARRWWMAVLDAQVSELHRAVPALLAALAAGRVCRSPNCAPIRPRSRTCSCPSPGGTCATSSRRMDRARARAARRWSACASSCANPRRCSGRSRFPSSWPPGSASPFAISRPRPFPSRPFQPEVAASLAANRCLVVVTLSPEPRGRPFAPGASRSSSSRRRPARRSRFATTTRIPKAGPRACWSTAPCSGPPGGSDPVRDVRRSGARGRIALHRLPRAGPGRHGHHGQRHLGPRLFDRRRAPPQADEAHRRHADAAPLLPAVVT